MSKNRIYFPKDERFNLFCISFSSTGIVIPLAQFGYPAIHLTVYIKKMQNKDGFQKLSIHLSNNQTSEIINECFLEFNEELLKQHYSEKFQRFVDKYLSIIKKYIVEEKNLQNKKLVCYDCFCKKLVSSYPVHKKEMAVNSYKYMIKDLKKIDQFTFEPCSDSKHRLLIDVKTGKIYMKTLKGILKFSRMSKMEKELWSVYKEVFPDEINWMKTTIKNFKKTLTRYKE
ncbi:MAG: hypothetical protein ABIF85_07585 [Nanoarchaeota archaeon]